MRIIVCVLALAFVGSSVADEGAKAAAALALAQAERERLRNKPASTCHTDIETAVAEANKSGQRVLLWVGMHCETIPDFRKELGEGFIHCHRVEHGGSMTSRVILLTPKGDYAFPRDRIDPGETARLIRSLR